MRILVVTPVWHRYRQSLESILALQSEGPLDFLLLANDDPYADGSVMGAYRNITRKLNHAREVCLRGDYAAMLIVEDDMLAPPDALLKLMQVEAEVVYGLCCFRHGTPGWSARTRLTATEVAGLADDADRARAAWGQVVDVAGVGTYCTLLRREVVEALPFRLVEEQPVCCDWWLSVDCQQAGFGQKAHLGVVCGHITPWPTPRVIWPDANEERLWRVTRL